MKQLPEDRPWSIDEIRSEQRTTWIVEFYGVKRLFRCGGWIFNNVLMITDVYYNQAWRAWPYLPSDELRNATAWDNPSQYIATLIEANVRTAMRPYNDLTRNMPRKKNNEGVANAALTIKEEV